MLSRDKGSKFLHRLCRHYFFCEVVPVRDSSDEEAVSVGVCFCAALGEAAVAVSGELPDDVAGGKSDLLEILICLFFQTGVRKGSAGMRPEAVL